MIFRRHNALWPEVDMRIAPAMSPFGRRADIAPRAPQSFFTPVLGAIHICLIAPDMLAATSNTETGAGSSTANNFLGSTTINVPNRRKTGTIPGPKNACRREPTATIHVAGIVIMWDDNADS
jgi:hypothetical protein